MAKEFHFDAGLDPEFRIAQNVSELSAQKTMLRLRGFAEKYDLKGLFDAKFIKAGDLTDRDAFDIAASVLRDCYGKINVLVLPASAPALTNAAAKLMKAYRKDVRVHVVTVQNGAALPDAIDVSLIDESESVPYEKAVLTAQQAKELDNISINETGGAVLFAARAISERKNDKHARYVLFLPQ